MPPDWEKDPNRWVLERKRYLSSSDLGLREKVAEAVAWSELGYSASGIAKQMDVGDTTAAKYLSDARELFPGITTRTVLDIQGRVDAPIDGIGPIESRQCPVCLSDRVCSPDEIRAVYLTSDWGATSMMDDAELVCAFCHSVRIDGVWERMETIDSRAYKLGEASGSKSSSQYRELLERGIDTGKPKPTAEGAEDW